MGYRIAQIGLKGHTGYVLGSVDKLEGAEVVAVADDNVQAIEKMREDDRYGDTEFYTDWREMVGKADFDIGSICTTNGEHFEALCACCDRGAHIICEKPLVTGLDELEDVKLRVKDAGVHLTMMIAMRFDPVFEAIRNEIHQGAIGKVCLVTAQKSYKIGTRPDWMKERETYGGSIPFVGIHALDFIRWTTGLEFVEGAAFHANAGHPEVHDMEDSASIIFRLSNGATGTTRIDFCNPPGAPRHGDDRLRVAGNEGVIEYIAGQDVILTTDEPPHVVTLPPKQDFLVDFVESIDGKHEPRIPAEDCYRITEVCLRLRQAADQGTIVNL